MSNIGDRLRQIRIEKGLNQSQLAELLQCSDKTISCYENNKNLDKVYDFKKICDYLKADINYLITGKEYNSGKEITQKEKQILSAYHNLSDSDKRIVDYILDLKDTSKLPELIQTQEIKIIYRLPIYQQDVAAGSGQLGFDQKHTMEEFSENDMPSKISYGVKIKGNSMETDNENNIPDGSTVLITTDFEYDELIGQAIIANLNGVLVCKEYNIAEDGHLWLKSRNPNKSNEDRHIYNLDNIKIIGLVVKVVKK